MSGYLTEAGDAIAPLEARDGHISVGDLGTVDRDGWITLVEIARTTTIITGGLNVYPAEVERALAALPEVAGAVVFGIADDDWGQIVAAVIASRHPALLDGAAVRAALCEPDRRLQAAARGRVLRTGRASDRIVGQGAPALSADSVRGQAGADRRAPLKHRISVCAAGTPGPDPLPLHPSPALAGMPPFPTWYSSPMRAGGSSVRPSRAQTDSAYAQAFEQAHAAPCPTCEARLRWPGDSRLKRLSSAAQPQPKTGDPPTCPSKSATTFPTASSWRPPSSTPRPAARCRRRKSACRMR